MSKISHASLLDLVVYDEALGTLVWRLNRGRALAGKPVGSINETRGIQYKSVKMNRISYTLHHVIWFYHKAQWPRFFIEHIDGNTLNNRIENLREAPVRLNRGKERYSKSGHVGVRIDPRAITKPWRAYLTVNKKQVEIGYFATKEEAIAAREEAFARKQEIYNEYFGANNG